MPKKTTSSVLLVGSKPTMNYCLYVVNELKDAKTIIIKARGRAIYKAVNVAEILRRKFL